MSYGNLIDPTTEEPRAAITPLGQIILGMYTEEIYVKAIEKDQIEIDETINLNDKKAKKQWLGFQIFVL